MPDIFFLPILNAFIIIAIGYVIYRTIGFDQKRISDLLIYVTGPCLIFTSLYTQKFVLADFFALAFAAIVIVLNCGLAMKLLLMSQKIKSNGMMLPAMFMNSGYLGFPVTLFALGEVGLAMAVIFDAVESMIHFTIGIFLVQDASKRKRERAAQILMIPLIYAVVLGIGLNLMHFQAADIVIQPLKLIGSITIPLALIALGARLGELKVFSWKIPALALFVRFVLGFAIGFAFVQLFNITGLVRAVILLLSVMPPAVNSFVLNQKFGKHEDSEAAASAVFIGTLLSFIVIGAVLAIL